jgi:hypothetical protein
MPFVEVVFLMWWYRNTLYPRLCDHDMVQAYPPVRGFAKDVFFFSHNHRENDGEDLSSKFNTFEVHFMVSMWID